MLKVCKLKGFNKIFILLKFNKMKVKNIKSDTHTLRSFKIAKLTSLIPKLSTFFKIFAHLVKYFIKRFTKYRAYAKIN